MTLLDERLVANVAAIRTLITVDANVVDQVDFLYEADAANQAFVRSFTGVNLGVV